MLLVPCNFQAVQPEPPRAQRVDKVTSDRGSLFTRNRIPVRSDLLNRSAYNRNNAMFSIVSEQIEIAPETRNLAECAVQAVGQIVAGKTFPPAAFRLAKFSTVGRS